MVKDKKKFKILEIVVTTKYNISNTLTQNEIKFDRFIALHMSVKIK